LWWKGDFFKLKCISWFYYRTSLCTGQGRVTVVSACAGGGVANCGRCFPYVHACYEYYRGTYASVPQLPITRSQYWFFSFSHLSAECLRCRFYDYSLSFNNEQKKLPGILFIYLRDFPSEFRYQKLPQMMLIFIFSSRFLVDTNLISFQVYGADKLQEAIKTRPEGQSLITVWISE
jgi:hypothetical protein